ncbi:S-adenosyl-L-methionine-dependent methyltransferase [Ustulina deusta]|nr:S-adenosyl-L-methionine-dependent methyltransferase [Ustulina deusta]
MPRLAPSLFRRAGRISAHLATLLPSCRTIEAAQAELRWIRRHALDTYRAQTEAGTQRDGDALSPRNGQDLPRARAGTRKRGPNPGLGAGRTRLEAAEDRVARLVARRGAGEPLQYVLGSQPFGDLEILCEKGVLIPRPETEAWAAMLADLVLSSPLRREGEGEGEEEGGGGGLRILDLCSGTGCIGLSLYARCMAGLGRGGDQETAKAHPPLRVFGFDVEPRAVRLATRNLAHNFRGSRLDPCLNHHGGFTAGAGQGAVTFRRGDIFTDEWVAYLDEAKPLQYADGDKGDQAGRVDVLVSNPPYISQRGFEADTGRSVRNYEPKIALVPARAPSSFPTAPPFAAPRLARTTTCAPEDIFYERLLDLADTLRPRIAVFEVGDMKQAIRVVEMAVARSRPQHRHDPDKTQKGGGDEPRGQTVARWDVLEIWRDWPDCQPSDAEADVVLVGGREVPVRGSGHGRVVFLVEGRMVWNRFTNRGFRREVYTAS